MENMDFTVKMISDDGLDIISYDSNFYIEDGILYHGTEELARDIEDDILYAVEKIIEFCSDTVLEITDQDDEIVYKNEEFEDDEFEDVLDESKTTTINFKALNEELKKFVESNLPEFQKMDKLCDLDKHLSESGRYIGMKDSKYGIYKYTRTTQKFNGSWNYDYKLISPEFDEELDAIDWLAQDLLSNNSKQDFIDCIKEGSFKIYNDNLKQIMDLDVEEGTLNTNPKFPTDNKGIDPVPNYMLEPNKAKANNLRREYVQTHGKTYESLNEKVPTWAEGGPLLVPVEEKPREKKDYEIRMEQIRQEIADILKDVPESEDVPKTVKEGWGDSIEKWIKVEFQSVAPWHKEWIDKVDYAWFGLVKPDSTHFKPIVIASKNRDYHLNGGGWDYFSNKGADDKRWLPILEDALKAVKAKFGK